MLSYNRPVYGSFNLPGSDGYLRSSSSSSLRPVNGRCTYQVLNGRSRTSVCFAAPVHPCTMSRSDLSHHRINLSFATVVKGFSLAQWIEVKQVSISVYLPPSEGYLKNINATKLELTLTARSFFFYKPTHTDLDRANNFQEK